MALMVWSMTQAAQVSETAARSIAAQFMQERGMGALDAAKPMKAPRRQAVQSTATSDDAAYYVFNAKPGKGFVIVSGDDRTEPVLGYSDRGNFDASNVPENMQGWLDQYVEEIAMLDAGLINLDEAPAIGDIPNYVSSSIVVEPLIETHWSQRAPYYFQCPQLNSKYCVTGCTATSMAQIMYYHQWPSSTSRFIPAYTTKTNNISLSQLGTTIFNWSAMRTDYTGTETSTTDAANAAVARLMRYCGQAVEMDYGTSSSTASGYGEVFVDYFRYSTKARKVNRIDYTYSQWTNMILTELAANRPLIYYGGKASGAHYFVCDGYDGKGYYHINWGWSGDSDGYFLLTSLNPDGGGTGSIAGNNGYMLNNMILIGLEPNTVSTTEMNSLTRCYNVKANGGTTATYTRSSSSDMFAIRISSMHINHAPVSRTYDIGWGVYKSDGHTIVQQYTTNQISNKTLGKSETTELSSYVNFGKDLADGTYYIRPISRESGSSTWRPCHYSGAYYIQAQINGNTLKLTTSTLGDASGVTAYIDSYGVVKKVNRPLEISVTAVNRSTKDYLPFYLFANDVLVGANSLKVSSGSSGTVKISYTPSTSGTNNLKVTADSKGENVYCTGSVDVSAASEASLSMTYTVPAANSDRQVAGTTLQFTTTVTNNKSVAYNDYIKAIIYKRDGTSNTYIHYREIMKPVNIAGSKSSTQYFTFNDLEPTRYLAVFYYYNYNTETEAAKTSSYQVGYLKGDLNDDGSVNTGDVSTLYKALLSGSTASKYDLNGDGSVNTGDVSALYKIVLGK